LVIRVRNKSRGVTRNWVFNYYKPVTKKRTTIGLGNYPEVPLASARALRDEYRSVLAAGILSMKNNPPHNGEMHPDGDEVLYVISGRLRVTGETHPDEPLDLGPGEACITRKGEWHQVGVLELTRLVHITPGPHGEHRPLA